MLNVWYQILDHHAVETAYVHLVISKAELAFRLVAVLPLHSLPDGMFLRCSLYLKGIYPVLHLSAGFCELIPGAKLIDDGKFVNFEFTVWMFIIKDVWKFKSKIIEIQKYLNSESLFRLCLRLMKRLIRIFHLAVSSDFIIFWAFLFFFHLFVYYSVMTQVEGYT